MKIKKQKILSIWFLLLLASFAYEKPVWIISGMDRLNPRLFDIVTVLGIFLLPLTKKVKAKNEIYNSYKKLIIWFGICAFFSITFYSFPYEVDSYIVYFYLKYLQELLVLFIALRVLSESVNIHSVFRIFLLSGLFVFAYSIYELLYGVVGEIEYLPGKFMTKPPGVIWGPFGKSYFQIANYLPLLSLFSFAYASCHKGFKKIYLYFFSAMVAWPLLFTGSRTGIGLLFLSFLLFLLFRYKLRYSVIKLSLVGLLLIIFLFTEKGYDFQTIERLSEMENNDSNSLGARLFLFENFDLSTYVHDGILLPFFGGGFYVAPADGNYRIGYGFHNIFIFALEQAGVLGLIFFFGFLKISYKKLKKGLKTFSLQKNSLEFIFIAAVLSYFAAQLILGLGGHTFWRGFGTNNFNTLRILLLLLATSLFLQPITFGEKQKNTELKKVIE